MQRRVWQVNVNGTAFCHGVDMGNGTQPITLVDTRYVDGKIDILVMKVPGGTHFVAQGSYRTHGSEYVILKVHEHLDFSTFMELHCEEIVTVPIRTTVLDEARLSRFFDNIRQSDNIARS